jgi:hypothetical protein
VLTKVWTHCVKVLQINGHMLLLAFLDSFDLGCLESLDSWDVTLTVLLVIYDDHLFAWFLIRFGFIIVDCSTVSPTCWISR